MSPKGPSLPFGSDLENALERGRTDGKPVVVAFVAAWRPLCTEMKRDVFRDPQLLDIAEDFVWVLVDIDRQLSVAREHGVEAVPLIKVYDAAGAPLDSMLGLWDATALGYKWELRDRGTLELGIIENFISFDNTPDIAYHAGFSQRF